MITRGDTTGDPSPAHRIDQEDAALAIKATLYIDGKPLVAYLAALSLWANAAGEIVGIGWEPLPSVPIQLDHITPATITTARSRYIYDPTDLHLAATLPTTSWLPD